MARLQDFRCVFPPCKKFDVVEVTEHDLARLDDGEFLNDTVIDFFIKYDAGHPSLLCTSQESLYVSCHCVHSAHHGILHSTLGHWRLQL